MTEEKMILNDGQYDLDMRTREVSASADVLADKGWYKLASNEQIVKKVELTKEEAEWFEKHKDFPFYNSNIDFNYILAEQAEKYSDTVEQDFINRMSQAYFNGYTIKKEKKYYIKFNLDGDVYGNGMKRYLNISGVDDEWWISSKYEYRETRTKFTQEEIDEMQKDPRAKGLDLNALKVEVPEDELED